MISFCYRLLEGIAQVTGAWFLSSFARVVALGYFCTKNHRPGIVLYRRLFPHRSRLFYQLCVFKQYQAFTRIHLDRFLARQGDIPFHSVGLAQLAPEALSGRGAILLMSHLGNWEMAARLLPQAVPGLKLLLFMGKKQKEGVEAAQKEELRAGGVRILAQSADADDPTLAVEGIRFAQAGGVVSLPGDLLLKPEQRHFVVDFLGGRARIPAAPFVLAHLAHAPLYAFLAFRERNTGAPCYHFQLSPPLNVAGEAAKHAQRENRAQALQQAAQEYARFLEQALQEHPFAWFHFDGFVEEKDLGKNETPGK